MIHTKKIQLSFIDIDEENSQLITIDGIPLNSIESMQSGTYLIKITAGENQFITKVVVE